MTLKHNKSVLLDINLKKFWAKFNVIYISNFKLTIILNYLNTYFEIYNRKIIGICTVLLPIIAHI